MRHHIEVLGLLHIVWGVFGVLAGLSLAILAGGTHAAFAVGGTIGGAPRAVIWLLGMAAALMISAGIAWFVIGQRLRRFHTTARLAAIALAVPNLLLLPFGTALGVYTFWVLLNNDARDTFGRPPRGVSA